MLALGTFFPILILSGVVWSVAAMPWYLQIVSVMLPTTWAADALRSIMGRGWGLAQGSIQFAFVFCIAWSVLFFYSARRGLVWERLKKSNAV